MNYPLASAILGFAAGASLDQRVVDEHHMYRKSIRRLDGAGFGREVERLMTNYDPGVVAVQLNLLGSHDAPRALTVMSGDVSALQLATTLQLTLPGAPCIYYGDEIAMAGHHDPDCRRAYPVEPGGGDQALRAYVTALTAARRDHASLRRGEVRCIGAVGEAVVLERSFEGRRALVAVNAGRTAQDVPLDDLGESGDEEAAGPAWRPLSGLASEGVELRSTDGTGDKAAVRLPAQASAIYVEA